MMVMAIIINIVIITIYNVIKCMYVCITNSLCIIHSYSIMQTSTTAAVQCMSSRHRAGRGTAHATDDT